MRALVLSAAGIVAVTLAAGPDGDYTAALAAGAHAQGPRDAADKELTPEEKMNRRFPQPVKVGMLIGLPLLDDDDLTIGYVRNVVRTPDGKIKLVVTQGGYLGPWFDLGTRLVPVAIEVVAILGRQLAALDMPRQEFATAKTWSQGDGQPIPPAETIRIAVARR